MKFQNSISWRMWIIFYCPNKHGTFWYPDMASSKVLNLFQGYGLISCLVNTLLFLFKTTRYVVEYGTRVKRLQVEVYLVEFKLCVHPNVNDTKSFSFSMADNIGECGNTCMLWHYGIGKHIEIFL